MKFASLLVLDVMRRILACGPCVLARRLGQFHRRLAVFICGSSALVFAGCHSAKPPPPKPAAVTAADTAVSHAEKMSQAQNWPAAVQAWQLAANQFSLLNDQPRLAIAWHNLAQAEANLGQSGQAQQRLEQAANLNKQLGRTDEWWRNQIALLQVEAQTTNTAALKERFQKLIPESNQLTNPLVKATYLNELGLWEQSQGNLNQALQNFRQAQQLFQSAHDAVSASTVLANIARLQETEKNFPAAIQTWQTVLGQFESMANPAGIADALSGLGRTYLAERKNLPLAEDYLRRAVRNYGLLRKGKEQAATHELLAQALAAQGK